MSLKAQLEAIIYAAETPVTLEQIVQLVKESVDCGGRSRRYAEVKSRVRLCLEELSANMAAPPWHRDSAGGRRLSHVHQAGAA
jgi:chromosome segregation and condensation protein ScpB